MSIPEPSNPSMKIFMLIDTLLPRTIINELSESVIMNHPRKSQQQERRRMKSTGTYTWLILSASPIRVYHRQATDQSLSGACRCLGRNRSFCRSRRIILRFRLECSFLEIETIYRSTLHLGFSRQPVELQKRTRCLTAFQERCMAPLSRIKPCQGPSYLRG